MSQVAGLSAVIDRRYNCIIWMCAAGFIRRQEARD